MASSDLRSLDNGNTLDGNGRAAVSTLPLNISGTSFTSTADVASKRANDDSIIRFNHSCVHCLL